MNEIKNYAKLVDLKELVSSQYNYDLLSEINIIKIGPNRWSVTGDIKFDYEGDAFDSYFMDKLENFATNQIDSLLARQKIDTSNIISVSATFMNIDNYQDYKNLKEIINGLVGVKSTNITKFDKESIYYDIEVYGNLLNFVYEISDSSYINIDSFDTSKSEIIMSLKS